MTRAFGAQPHHSNRVFDLDAVLGERESGTARLEEAVSVYRAALQERTRERVPLDWATTQNNLGIALRMLGERESGTARLEEGQCLSGCAAGADPRARAVGLGHDADQLRLRAPEAGRAGEWNRAVRGGGQCLSSRTAGADPRAGAVAVGHDPNQLRHRAPDAGEENKRRKSPLRGAPFPLSGVGSVC